MGASGGGGRTGNRCHYMNLMSGNWVGAIVAATWALGGFITKLFGASEKSKKVSRCAM